MSIRQSVHVVGEMFKCPTFRVESDKAIFVDFGTQEVILGDSIIQNQC